ncbi:hypothetical protein L195_g038784 [Trifolium pratense]|uniref:Uncharacterized protein n=1 Tax=Trifolium pratense TaxID=57577 RepID=A0A2K3LW61_TRIPR|nr:hypothetical protein L195_g038784 [Trifolium pratense]
MLMNDEVETMKLKKSLCSTMADEEQTRLAGEWGNTMFKNNEVEDIVI